MRACSTTSDHVGFASQETADWLLSTSLQSGAPLVSPASNHVSLHPCLGCSISCNSQNESHAVDADIMNDLVPVVDPFLKWMCYASETALVHRQSHCSNIQPVQQGVQGCTPQLSWGCLNMQLSSGARAHACLWISELPLEDFYAGVTLARWTFSKSTLMSRPSLPLLPSLRSQEWYEARDLMPPTVQMFIKEY